MAKREIMTREEAFRCIARIGSAVLAGQPVPDDDNHGLQYMQAEDMVDGMHAFTRELAERFDKIPEKISDDVAVQEAIRQRFDEVFLQAVAGLEETIKKLVEK